jgi:hypothetical protein
MLHVTIDTREHDLWPLLEPWQTENDETWIAVKKNLDVGDIAFSLPGHEHPLVILERKTAEDFGASLSDGRYREQRSRLLALRSHGTSIGYILEFPSWSPSLTRAWSYGRFTELQLQQNIVRLQLRYTIPVFHATCLKETVQWIRRIAVMLVADPKVFTGGVATDSVQAAAYYKNVIHVKKASNKTPDTIFHTMLLTVPGLGKSAVEAISVATHSSFQTLLTKSVEELADINTGKRKLGKKLATALHTLLHS